MTMDVLALNPEWKHVKSLGKGNNAAVHLFEHLPTERQWAVKFVERGDLIDDSFRKEMINHRSLQHKNIIQFHEVLLTPGYLAIVMEYASGGDLFQYVKNFGPVLESVSRGIMQQLISGLGYAHSQGICHRDLKLENTLLEESANGLDVPVVKICDFGFAKSAQWQSKPKSKVGTPAYCAPEVFMATSQDYDGKAADVWSLGVKLHVMLTQRYPFAHPSSPLNDRLMLKQVVKYWKGEVDYEPPLHVSGACKDTLRWMLAADPAKRMTVQQMLEWPWFEMAGESREVYSPRTPKPPPLEDLTAIFEMAKKNPTKVDVSLTQTDDCSDIENSDYEDDSGLIE